MTINVSTYSSAGTATCILAIPMKRTTRRLLEYVSREEMDTVLETLDRKHWCGRRDYALLLTMYNSGAVSPNYSLFAQIKFE
jgi:integrase/recombinase XerD